jgi:adenylosuccinate synthase
MLQKDTAWISTRVRPDGSVDTSGSTRVDGRNSEISPLGVKKKLAVAEVYESLAGWSKISGDKSYEDLAMKVAHGPRDRD